MELELSVAQPVDLLDKSDSKNLIAAETPAACIRTPIPHQISLHEFAELFVRLENPGDHLQLSGMLVGTPSGRERELGFSELAHRFTPRLCDLLCKFGRLVPPNIHQSLPNRERRLRQFLFYPRTYDFPDGK